MIKEKDKQITDLTKEKDKNIDSLRKEIDKINKDNSNLKDQLNKIEDDIVFYENFYKEYSKIVEKFENILKTYKTAEDLYKKVNYTKALTEYEKILSEFNEINDSYKKIQSIQANYQNLLAIDLYKNGIASYNKGDFISSYNFFSELLIKAPQSTYVKDSLDKLLLISKLLNDKERENIDNTSTQKIFKEAQNLINKKEYKAALEKYKQIIVNYPYSKQTEQALKEYEMGVELLRSSDKEIYDKELIAKFNENYNFFSRYYKEGNIERARKYYFIALQHAFDMYTNFSLNDFKEIDDKYIELLIKLNENAMKDKYSIQ